MTTSVCKTPFIIGDLNLRLVVFIYDKLYVATKYEPPQLKRWHRLMEQRIAKATVCASVVERLVADCGLHTQARGSIVPLGPIRASHPPLVDLVDVSSGGLVHDANIKPFPGYQVELAREIREQAGIHVTTVGLITEPEHAEEILRNNNADAVMLGRALLRNPRWALNAAESLGYECRWPQQLQRARTINPRKSPQ